MNTHLELVSGGIDVWSALLDVSSACQSVLKSLLSPDEIDRANRFIFEIDRQRFIAARGILRSILGRYCDLPPATIRFVYGKQDKPFLSSSPLFFNISHSANAAIIAVTKIGEVGIDLEYIDPDFELSGIIQNYFAPAESQALSRLSGFEHRERFYTYWTRKEAYLKAKGVGLIDDLPTINSFPNLDVQDDWFHLSADGVTDPRILMRDIPVPGDFRAALAFVNEGENPMEPPDFRIKRWAEDEFI